VSAAIEAAPDADVVFVAHTVLEDIGSFRDLWARVPLATPILGRYWRIPAPDVPHEQDALIDWLFGWWTTIDGWIGDRRLGTDSPPAVREAQGSSADLD
jgi:hypothetical protein